MSETQCSLLKTQNRVLFLESKRDKYHSWEIKAPAGGEGWVPGYKMGKEVHAGAGWGFPIRQWDVGLDWGLLWVGGDEPT